MSDGQLRVAVLGAGYFSQFHVGSWRRLPRVTLAGQSDRDMGRAGAQGLPAFDDLDRMLDKIRPDLLDIVIPPDGHAGAIRLALTHGLRAIICQKPFCRNLEEARDVVEAARVAGARIVVHENFRFQPWYRALHHAIATRRIGDPLQATFRLRPGDGQGSSAYLDRQPYFQKMPRFLVHETAVHWIDTFRFLFGDPSAVYADLRRINQAIAGEDAGYLIFDHPNGVRALFDGNRHLDHAADNLRRTMGEALIEGTEGTLSLAGDGSVTLRRFGKRDGETLLAPDTWGGFGGDCVHALQSHVVAGLLDGAPIENAAADYLRVIAIEEAIYASAEAGRKVEIPAP